jgi:hypothetical protein
MDLKIKKEELSIGEMLFQFEEIVAGKRGT